MLVNRERLEMYLAAAQLDAVIVASPANVTYLSGYACWVDPQLKAYMVDPAGDDRLIGGTYAVATRGRDEAALVVNSLFAAGASTSWVDHIYVWGNPSELARLRGHEPPVPIELQPVLASFEHLPRAGDPVAGVVAALRDLGVASGRIGLELAAAALLRDELAALLPKAEIVDCSKLLRLVRMVKSADELDRLARAAEISELVAMECGEMCEPSHSAVTLIDHFSARVASLGGTIDHLAFGPLGLGIGSRISYRFRQGDVMYMDFGCVYRGYFSDAGLTLAIGELPRDLARTYEALRDAVEAGTRAVRPGQRASAPQAIMRAVLDDAGIEASNPHGHGLGLELRELPILTAASDQRIADGCVNVPSDLPLEEGMVINLESALFFPGRASLHIEESFVVEKESCRPLLTQARKAPLQAGRGTWATSRASV